MEAFDRADHYEEVLGLIHAVPKVNYPSINLTDTTSDMQEGRARFLLEVARIYFGSFTTLVTDGKDSVGLSYTREIWTAALERALGFCLPGQLSRRAIIQDILLALSDGKIYWVDDSCSKEPLKRTVKAALKGIFEDKPGALYELPADFFRAVIFSDNLDILGGTEDEKLANQIPSCAKQWLWYHYPSREARPQLTDYLIREHWLGKILRAYCEAMRRQGSPTLVSLETIQEYVLSDSI